MLEAGKTILVWKGVPAALRQLRQWQMTDVRGGEVMV